MAGSWDSTRALQVASKSGRIAPSALHSCSTNSTICCSVVSLVRNSSMSVTRSMQMAQVREFSPLGREDPDTRRLARRRMRGIFMTKAETWMRVTEAESEAGRH